MKFGPVTTVIEPESFDPNSCWPPCGPGERRVPEAWLLKETTPITEGKVEVSRMTKTTEVVHRDGLVTVITYTETVYRNCFEVKSFCREWTCG